MKTSEHNLDPVEGTEPRDTPRHGLRARVIFLATGVLSTLWFLMRVIPKPSRATYPCMRVAAPFMSSFIAYLLGVAATAFAFKKARGNIVRAKYLMASLCILIGVTAAIFTLTSDELPVYANSTLVLGPNQPVGVPQGIFPGRVVWVWDPTATNENCSNKFDHGWFLPENTNLDVVETMVNDAVERLSGKSTVAESWDALFRYFNQRHGKGDVGYTDGEKIFIRTNQVSAASGTYNPVTFEIINQGRYGMAETSPQVALAIMRQLVNECGVKQENISIGDPMKHMYKHVFDMWHDEFPDVLYIDTDAWLGRTKPVASKQQLVYYSDRGTILKVNGTTGAPFTADSLPTVITDADYLIAIPAMKAHARGGVTLCGKLHFGSNLYGSATHLHGGLIAPNMVKDSSTMRPGYGLYRVQVDLMGHKDLGGKTVLFLVDALWSGSEANDPPRKFSTTPFNNDWTSSVFVSEDQAAIESVCFDFLKAEFTSSNPYGSYPQVQGADDYIMQAADSSFWPTSIRYDPEKDGTTIGSLGVCEHWNNPIDKQYSRNLGTGGGIELVFLNRTVTAVHAKVDNGIRSFALLQNYPNPFNPTTHIRYILSQRGPVSLKVFDLTGREVATLVDGTQDEGVYTVEWNARTFPSGAYFYRLAEGTHSEARRLILEK
jgi:hypothetical protein